METMSSVFIRVVNSYPVSYPTSVIDAIEYVVNHTELSDYAKVKVIQEYISYRNEAIK